MRDGMARRLAWRLGRRLYKTARGEQAIDDIRTSGEALLQACVAKAVSAPEKFAALDIGANLGEWSFSLIEQLRASGRDGPFAVDLFEPVPSTADLLAPRLLASPDRARLRLHRAAMSEARGEAAMIVSGEGAGTNSLHGHAASRGDNRVNVRLETVAEFCRDAGIDHVHLAKCDTEGHDLAVLKGALPMLAEGRIDVFQFEYNHRWVFSRSFLRDVFVLIEGLPYHVCRVDPDGLEVFDAWHDELERFFQSNYVLVRNPVLHWFPVKRGAFDGSNVFSAKPGHRSATDR